MARRSPRRSSTTCDPAHGVIEQFDGYFDRLDVPVTEWDENNMPRYPKGYHHFNCEDTQLLKQPDVVMLMLRAARRVRRGDEEGQLRVLRGAHAAQVVAQPIHPRDHGDRGRRPVTRALQYFAALGVRRPHRQPGQHRRGHAHRLRGRHLADAGQRLRRLPGPAPPDVVPAVAARPTGRRSTSGSGGGATPSRSSIGHTEATFTLEAAEGVTEDVVVADQLVTLRANTPVTLSLTEPALPAPSSL